MRAFVLGGIDAAFDVEKRNVASTKLAAARLPLRDLC